MNRVSVRDANNPRSAGHGEVGTRLLSSFEDGHYNSTAMGAARSTRGKALKIKSSGWNCEGEGELMILW